MSTFFAFVLGLSKALARTIRWMHRPSQVTRNLSPPLAPHGLSRRMWYHSRFNSIVDCVCFFLFCFVIPFFCCCCHQLPSVFVSTSCVLARGCKRKLTFVFCQFALIRLNLVISKYPFFLFFSLSHSIISFLSGTLVAATTSYLTLYPRLPNFGEEGRLLAL